MYKAPIINFFFLCLLCFYALPGYTVDKSIYTGKWKGGDCDHSIVLDLTGQQPVVSLKNVAYQKTVQVEYTYSNLSPYPYLSILFEDTDETEHLLYLVIGVDKDNKSTLSGFYETTKIIENRHGELHSISRKMEFRKLGGKHE